MCGDLGSVIRRSQVVCLNDLAASTVDQPRVWHDDTLPGVVWMAGAAAVPCRTSREYIIRVTTDADTSSSGGRRGVRPGQVVVLDAEQSHQHANATASTRLQLPASLLMSALDAPPPVPRNTIDSPMSTPWAGERFLVLHRSSQAVRTTRTWCAAGVLDDLVPLATATPSNR